MKMNQKKTEENNKNNIKFKQIQKKKKFKTQ